MFFGFHNRKLLYKISLKTIDLLKIVSNVRKIVKIENEKRKDGIIIVLVS